MTFPGQRQLQSGPGGRFFRFFRLALAAARLFFAGVSGRFFKYWLPVILWMTLIFGASTSLGRAENTARVFRPILLWLNPRMSEQTFERIHGVIRKTAHFVEYCLLALLLWRLVHFDPALAAFRSREFLAALLAAAVYASTDEFHQLFVPGRSASVRDVLLDSCGAGIGLAALWAGRRLRPKK
jgi:VanZ family protein